MEDLEGDIWKGGNAYSYNSLRDSDMFMNLLGESLNTHYGKRLCTLNFYLLDNISESCGTVLDVGPLESSGFENFN